MTGGRAPKPKTYLFAGGGTGGHLAPGLAVAEAIAGAEPQSNCLFLCTDRPIDRRFLGPTRWGMIAQSVRPIPRATDPLAFPGFLVRWCRSLSLSQAVLRYVRPAAILGLGGYAAGPAVRLARRYGVRAGLLNPDAVAGRANRYLARRVEVIFTQFAQTADCLDAAVRPRVRCVGCPIRSDVLGVDRAAATRALGLAPDRRTLAVLGGSLGAVTINDAVAALADELAAHADTWQVYHVAGPGKARPVRDRYARAGTPGAVVEFCDHMGELYAAADLVIGCAGAGAVAELTATATPSILLPYPFHADRHQHRNAEPLAETGAAVVVEDTADTQFITGRLRGALVSLLDDPSGLAAMAAAAAGLGRAGAANDVAAWMLGG